MVKVNHDYERGLRKAQEMGPEKCAKVEAMAKEGGYSSVRHFYECICAESAEYIDGLVTGMGLDDDQATRTAGKGE